MFVSLVPVSADSRSNCDEGLQFHHLQVQRHNLCRSVPGILRLTANSLLVALNHLTLSGYALGEDRPASSMHTTTQRAVTRTTWRTCPQWLWSTALSSDLLEGPHELCPLYSVNDIALHSVKHLQPHGMRGCRTQPPAHNRLLNQYCVRKIASGRVHADHCGDSFIVA